MNTVEVKFAGQDKVAKCNSTEDREYTDQGLELIEAMSKIKEIVDESQLHIDECHKRIKSIEFEITDLEHYLEMVDFNACDGYKIAKQIQILRKERRKCKNTLELLTGKDDKLKGSLRHTGVLCLQFTKHQTKTSNQLYATRIRHDMLEEINKKNVKRIGKTVTVHSRDKKYKCTIHPK